ncbi:MAG: non-homologous end-joining DNA ligase [Bacteroidota bacterium]
MAKRETKTTPGNMPEHVEPMLCTLVKDPIESEQYLYELKWDGYRIISKVERKTTRMNSRSGLDYTSKYPLIAEALQSLGYELMIDGEVVVLNEEGKPDFDTLQLYNVKRTPIKYCVFDLLYLDGNDLKQLPLIQRKELLETITRDNDIFLFSESFDDGKALYEKVLEDNLEGIVAKKKDSTYVPGARSYDWLKIPTRKRQEFIIGGWAESDKSRSFKSLLFGAYENGKLQWIGRSGGGYKQAEMPGILKQLQEIETDKSPFANKILDTKGAKTHFVKPKLVANFEFATWTKSGRIRKPATFLGFRKDKDPKDVVREVPKETKAVEKVIEEEIKSQHDDQAETGNKTGHDDPVDKDAPTQKAELEKYRQKRSFDQTPEPQGGKAHSEKLTFVIQKHNASHLHYDFRLEIRGVLKSWAVPNGPSMNPKDHRLAMEVEDHPYDYKDFEGIIPEGQYGGGTVLVWDNGTYEPAELIKGKKEQEKWLLANYHKNKLSIILHGQKLKGKFNLIKTYGKAENAWLLTKAKDEEALDTDITKKDRSVISGYTILEMAMDSHSKIWQSNRTEPAAENSNTNKEAAELEAELAGPEVLDETTLEDEKEQAASPVKHTTVGALFPKANNKRSTRSKVSTESNWNKIFEEKIKSEGSIPIDNDIIHLTNIEKKLWKHTNKANLIAYYNSISEYILPHLKNRPLSLHIKNLNANAPGFYIKDMEGLQPDFLDIHTTKRKHKVKGKAEHIDYAVCNNLPALLWLINLGNIDLNPWNSTTQNPGEPDYIAIDLDPSDDDFKKVVKTALAAKDYFDEQKLTTFIKTSGKTGIHIFIPCKGFSFPQARKLAEGICNEIHKRVPMFTTLEVSVDKRGNKLFVDFSLNDEADTLASAYSVRPAKQPTVSTPIEWEELDLKLKPTDFNIGNMPARLESKGELWKDLHNPKIKTANSKILKTLLNQ